MTGFLPGAGFFIKPKKTKTVLRAVASWIVDLEKSHQKRVDERSSFLYEGKGRTGAGVMHRLISYHQSVFKKN